MTAQEIAQKLLNGEDYEHTARVVALCGQFVRAGLPVKEGILLYAAWLHDVGKSVADDKTHRKRKFIREALEPYRDDLKYGMDDLVEIIHAHGGDFEPPAGYELESAVLRLCDKIDRYNKGKSDAPKKCKESKEILKEILGEQQWDKFKASYWAIVAETIQGALNNPALSLGQETRELFQEKLEKAQKKLKKAQKKPS